MSVPTGFDRPVVAAVLLISLGWTFFAVLATAEEPLRFEDLAFMAGCFAGELPDGGEMRESYTPPRAGVMLGNSQVTRDGRTLFYELSRIVEEEGKVVYVPYPRGRESVPFTLTSLDPAHAVFVNPRHDFPQRIIYRVGEGDTLIASIDGVRDGEPAVQEWVLRRIACSE